jgi:hypothetical protein
MTRRNAAPPPRPQIQFISGTTRGVSFEDVRIDGTGTFAL